MKERKIYLDNLRILTVILVMIYHVFYLFNGVGVLGGFNVVASVEFFDSFCTLIYPWFMILLFCISGICAKYSMDKRGEKRFIKERTTKLLIPSTLGIIVCYWIVGYINISIGGGLDYIPDFLIYPISVISGIGPLWFAQLLFVFSLLTPFINKIYEKLNISEMCKKTKIILIAILGALIVWGSSLILNMPVITVYRFGIYFAVYLMGYTIFSNDKLMQKLEKTLPITGALTIIFCLAYMLLYNGKDYTTDEVLKSGVTNFYAWFAMIFILCIGKRYLNERYIFGERITKNTYAYYVLHYPILLSTAYIFYNYSKLSVFAMSIILLVLEFILTGAFAYIIKRIPIIRFILLGIRGKNEIQTDNR